MDDSILNSIKKLLGFEADYDAFDVDIQLHINTAFSILHQIGASPIEGFVITGETEKWSDFIRNAMHVEMVKTFVYLKVRLVFDPPQTSFAIKAIEDQIRELEFRLNCLELEFNPNAYGEVLLPEDVVILVAPVVPEVTPENFPIYTLEN